MNLTAKQTAFAHHVADGLTASEAYRRAYSGNPNKTTTRREAHQVRHNPAVSALIDELRKEVAALKLVDRATKRRVLTQIICDRDMDPRIRLEAIKLDNAMTGDNAPVKMEGEITLGTILKEIQSSTGLPSQDAKRT